MKKLVLLLSALCALSATGYAQEKTVSAKEQEKQEALEQAKADLTHTGKSRVTKEWTVTEEGTDELGEYTLESTYRKGVVTSSSFWKNWTISAGVGCQAYIGDNDWKAKFNHWWNFPSFDLYFNKWVSPVFGLGLGMTAYKMKGLYQTYEGVSIEDNPAHFKTDIVFTDVNGKYGHQTFAEQKGSFFNPFLILLLDLDNVIGGFNFKRFYNIDVYAGGGLIFGWAARDYWNYNGLGKYYGATFNAGIINNFRLYKGLHLTLNLRGALVSDEFDGEGRGEEPDIEHQRANVPFDGMIGATLGLTYRFGGTNEKEWEDAVSTVRTYKPVVKIDHSEIAALEADLAKAKAENDSLRQNQTHCYDYIKDPMHLWYHVQFVIDKWDVSRREMVNLNAIAEIMKKVPETKFTLCGYADMQTATPKHNLMLSENRVNQVYDILVNKLGVNPDQLTKDYQGGVDLMFYDDNVLSRCVIIKTEGIPEIIDVK